MKLHLEDAEKSPIKVVNYNGILYTVVNAVKEIYNDLLGTKVDLAGTKADLFSTIGEVASLKAENAQLKARADLAQRKNAALEEAVCEINPKSKICGSHRN